ncbi:hypothetical protein LTR27_005681 [Elasticomyces elasticus]|nr:hypothetical protein LTR27_005681 [Elasticomyces elasticus]
MELTTTTPSKQVVELTDFPHEILLQIFGYVVWTENCPHGDATNDKDYKRYLSLVARLGTSKYICSVVKEAYFTQRQFSIVLLGGLPTLHLRSSIGGRVHSSYSDDEDPPVLLSAFKHGTFADRDLYYENVRQLDIGIVPTIRTSALALAHLLTPVLDRCEEVASIDVRIVKVTAEWLKLGHAGDNEDETVKMIKSMVDSYEKRVKKAVRLRLRWL